MTIDEIRAEAEKLGYHVVKNRASSNPNMGKKKCRDCVWLDMSEKCTIGYECKNTIKYFRTWTAKYKYASSPCCKLFAEREVQDEVPNI